MYEHIYRYWWMGGYLLLTKQNKWSEAIAKIHRKSPEAISSLLGLGLIALGISCIPSWLAEMFNFPAWLHWVTVGLIFLSMLMLYLIEWTDKKKHKDDNKTSN